jgi:putative peptidoglycan lipid II flippase
MLLYIGAPLSVAIALHGETLVRVVFARGAFDARSVAATTTILQWLAAGLWAQLIGYAGAKFMSARGRNARAIAIYATAFGCNVGVNLLAYRILGAAALGLAAAVNSIVFGLLVMRHLGLLAPLARDLLTVGALAAAYVALWKMAPAEIASNTWTQPLAFASYWCVAAALIPRCRQVVHEAWSSFRTA